MRIILKHPPQSREIKIWLLQQQGFQHPERNKEKSSRRKRIFKNEFWKISGFYNRKGFIISQHPLESTVSALWQLVAEQDVQVLLISISCFILFLQIYPLRWSWCCLTWTTRTTQRSGRPPRPPPSCGTPATASTPSPSHARMSSCQGEGQNLIHILTN